MNLKCIALTGDSDIADFKKISSYNLIISTPEKWDSLSRRWKQCREFIEAIKLFMIDEVGFLFIPTL